MKDIMRVIHLKVREIVILWGARKLNARKKDARILKLHEN